MFARTDTRHPQEILHRANGSLATSDERMVDALLLDPSSVCSASSDDLAWPIFSLVNEESQQSKLVQG